MDRPSLILLLLSCCNFLQVLAQEPCSREGDVSIRANSSSTTSSSAGRVQYCLRPSSGGGSLYWALVCNSTFHLNEAHVACRSENPDYAAYNTLPGAIFSQVDLTYQVEVQCGGFESSMADCSVTEVSSSRCSVFVTAGVACNTGSGPLSVGEYSNSVFLFGSTRDTEGFVALYHDAKWNSLMVAPSHWTDTHADVVCRQIGYGGGVVPSDTSGYRQPTGLPLLQVSYVCPSSARGLGECTNTQQLSPSPMLAAVSCTLSEVTDGTLRLSRGSTDAANQGTLEIVFNGRFGAVCSSGFDSSEANVTCRQLGYESGSWSTRTVLASRPFYLSGLDCTGSETSLLSCPYTNPPGYPCSSETGVRVTCSSSSPEEDEEGTPEEEEGGLNGGGIAGIVISCVAIFIVIVLSGVYHKQIKVKLVEAKTRVQNWWNNLSICPRTNVASSSSQPSSSYPSATAASQRRRSSEEQREEAVVQEPERTAETNPRASSQTPAEPEEPQNPQLSAEAPPTYRDADQFHPVTEEEDLEKPPPYMDPVDATPSAPPPVGGVAYVLPVAPPYLPTAPAYPPGMLATGPAYPTAYPPVDPAYPTAYPPVDPAYPPTYPPTDPAYPPLHN